MDELNLNKENTKSSSKPFLAGVIIMMAVLCAAGMWVKQTQKQAQTERDNQEQTFREESAQMVERINEANANYLAEANRINAEQHDPLDPATLVQQLYKLKDLPDNKARSPRAFYCLQGLLLNGTNALPALKDLLIDGYDFNLDARPLYNSRTLRQEIASLLVSMGNRPAADLLSQLLPATQTVEELANLCKALMSVSDGYRPYCISAARDKYNQLIEKQKELTPQKTGLLEKAVSFLKQDNSKNSEQLSANRQDLKKIYNLLFTVLKDEEFAIELLEKREWLQENGRIDSALFSEATAILPSETVMDYCYEAYLRQKENHKKTDISLITTATENIANPKATEMLLTELKEASPIERYTGIMGLSLDPGFGAALLIGSSPRAAQRTSGAEDPNQIQKANDRLLFLDAVEAQFPDDEKLIRIVGMVRSNLQHTASTDPDKGTWVADEESKNFFQNLASEAIDKAVNDMTEMAVKEIDEKNNKQEPKK
ncbi:MAG: hypothetical protein IJU47_05025 [Verrucomicrobia bacterium]|nr:hypothetical protein [Verrucomicrobiota bacterium]